MMSLFAGRLPDIASVTCNSIALTPRVPTLVARQADLGPPLFQYVLRALLLDPRFAQSPKFTRDWVLGHAGVDLAHRECDVSACHMLSFMWGSGHPAMYEHDNLQPVTHERMADLCSACGTQLLPARRQDGAGRPRGAIRPRRPAAQRPARRLPGQRGQGHDARSCC